MSVYIHPPKSQSSTFQPVIRSEHELLIERENFRNTITNKDNLELITSIFGTPLISIIPLIFKETAKSIRDPEHPYTIEQLDVINLKDIEVTGNY